MTDHRDFLAIPDFSRKELEKLFDLGERMRTGKYDRKPLAGKSLAMIFMKASTRTRVSFEVGAWQLGGHALFLSPRDIQRENPEFRAQDDVTAVDPGPLPALDELPAPVDVQRFLADPRHPRAEVFNVAGDGLR